MQNDIDYGFLEKTSHRPYPMPDEPWLMTQSWHDLAFIHWPVDRKQLQAALPVGMELDIFEGQAYIGVVPFYMTNVAPRGIPALPLVSSFHELNVRTYVVAQDTPGIYFFSLDASNPVAVGLARSMFHLPYYTAVMRHELHNGWLHYRSSRLVDERTGQADFEARYRATGPVFHPKEGTLEHFLTERYCLFTLDGDYKMRRVDIHHDRWPLQAAEIVLDENTMIDQVGVRIPDMAPLVHYVERQDMVAWRLTP